MIAAQILEQEPEIGSFLLGQRCWFSASLFIFVGGCQVEVLGVGKGVQQSSEVGR